MANIGVGYTIESNWKQDIRDMVDKKVKPIKKRLRKAMWTKKWKHK